ncbi:hypothetical protein KEM52_005570 [Ascosphaera acerosa]|nr:hypothetical protein KEM52_005570 [Ascosphaera acerosa]
MPTENIFASVDRDVNPFSRANTARKGLKIDIKLEDEKSVNSYTTLDAIKGAVLITADTKSTVDGVLISFEGSSRTSIEQPSVVVPSVGRSTAFHTFLRLVQPIKKSQFPEHGVFQRDETYTFPFTFVVPEHLLPQACAHEHSNARVHDAHTRLPPSLGDPIVSGNGRTLLNDLSPDTCHIQYVVRVQLLRNADKGDRQAWVYHNGLHNRPVRVIATANKRIRVVPATDEEPPLMAETLAETEYCLQREKEIKKGALRGRSGHLVMAAAQPRAFKIKGIIKGETPPTTVVTVHLRFDPAEAKQRPPKLGMLYARLKANTFYSAIPWSGFPEKTFALRWDTKRGVHTETVPLTSMRVANAEWKVHEATVPASRFSTRHNTDANMVRPSMRRSYSAGSALSSETETSSIDSDTMESLVRSGVPSPSTKADPSLPYYTASIVVPLVISEKTKTFLPTFHSCLTSRTYVLDIGLSYHPVSKTSTTILNAPSISIKVPVQITTEKSLSDLSETSARDREAVRQSRAAAREARRQRLVTRGAEFADVGPAESSDTDVFFVPRPVGPMACATQPQSNAYVPALARAPSLTGPVPPRGPRPTAADDPMSPLADTTPCFDPTTPFNPTASLHTRRDRGNTVSSTLSVYSNHSDVSQHSNASTLPPEYSNLQHRLLIIIALAALFVAAEIAVGFRTHSLAVVADAFHYFGDLSSDRGETLLGWLDERKTDTLTQYCIHAPQIKSKGRVPRARDKEASADGDEVLTVRHLACIDALAGFFNGSFLFALGLSIMLQGIERFVRLEALDKPMMVLIMGCAGLAINVISVLILHEHGHAHGHGHTADQAVADVTVPQDVDAVRDRSWSIQSVLLHVACDALNNLALIVASAIVWKLPSNSARLDVADGQNLDHRSVDPKNYADPACTILIATLIMVLSVRLIRDTGRALMALGSAGVA